MISTSIQSAPFLNHELRFNNDLVIIPCDHVIILSDTSVISNVIDLGLEAEYFFIYDK